MNDTSRKIHLAVLARLNNATPFERLQMTCDMFELSKELAYASIDQNEPHLPPKVMREKIFMRFYGHEFSQERIQKILARLSSQ